MTRVLGLLSWFDESAIWLSATITSLAPHIDHLIALDGAYALYPDGRAQSRSDQACAIVETCQAASLGLTLHRPNTPWFGNEVEKRNRMWRLAELEAEPNVDWLWVIDADIVVDRCPHDLRAQLAATDLNVAEATVWERGDPYKNAERIKHESLVALPADFYYPLRMLFRALPGIHCATNHYSYLTGDGRKLWGYPGTVMEEAHGFNGLLQVEHRTHYRAAQRHKDAQTYYQRRDRAGVEKKAAA